MTEPLVESPRPPNTIAARVSALPQPGAAVIGKTITIAGDITGAEALHIEGRVKGRIGLEGAYLNIGPEAVVQSDISAREVVVRGTLTGQVNVSERIDIRNGGSLVGDVSAHSVSIEEGAYFKGSIDMRRSESTRQSAPSVSISTSPKLVEPERATVVSA
ncbi:MAG: polymer-forming cytoskeletal protein [Acidobacteriia bacterium]|nr:polymer-forming cytoskeletal protein [Terriglobia bacterium]